MSDLDLSVQIMLWAFIAFMAATIGLIIYCGIKSGPNPKTGYYIVAEHRRRVKRLIAKDKSR